MSEWQRLDRRMLLVHPIREVVRFLPALLALLVFGTASDGPAWQYLGVLVPIGLGLLRYLTTRYRLGADRVELRRGLLSRHVLTTSVDRIRTVDLTSSPTHRVLGLTTVRIGTGDDEGALDLDGLRIERARRLRAELLREAPAATPDPSVPVDPPRAALRLDPRWSRFAPLTGAGLALGLGALGVLLQGFTLLGDEVLHLDDLADDSSGPSSWWIVVTLAALLLVVAIPTLAVAGYLAVNWDFTLRHTPPSWHLSRGLFTTRETTLADERVAGADLVEPLGLRLGGGARLDAIVTGVDRDEDGSALLVPAAPSAVVAEVAARVLGTAAPIEATLVRHGPAAVRRIWIRALDPVLTLLLAGVVAVLLGAPTWSLAPGLLAVPVAALLAVDRARALGHALVDGHLVARSGSLARRREMLGTDHVIGWTLRETWFQRRAGLATLVATTAGGRQAVTVPDVPLGDAVDLADAAVPGLLTPFRETGVTTAR